MCQPPGLALPLSVLNSDGVDDDRGDQAGRIPRACCWPPWTRRSRQDPLFCALAHRLSRVAVEGCQARPGGSTDRVSRPEGWATPPIGCRADTVTVPGES